MIVITLFILGDSEHQHCRPERVPPPHPQLHQHEVPDPREGTVVVEYFSLNYINRTMMMMIMCRTEYLANGKANEWKLSERRTFLLLLPFLQC